MILINRDFYIIANRKREKQVSSATYLWPQTLRN